MSDAASVTIEFPAASALGETASLPDFRLPGALSDDAALAAAIFAGRKAIHLPKGKGSHPSGDYIFDAAWGTNNIASGLSLIGDGIDETIIRRITTDPSHTCLFFNSGSASLGSNLDGLWVEGITFKDDVATLGFDEQNVLCHLNGVSNVMFYRCKFKGFRGDGLLFGSGHLAGVERHNVNILVIECQFDGVNNQNRNGITVIDGDRVTIEGCTFTNVTKTDGSMPGPIDIEPNVGTYAVIRNITVRRNSFLGCGGAATAFLLQPANGYTTAPGNFTIEGNWINACQRAFTFFGYSSGTPASSAIASYGARYLNNHIRDCTGTEIVILSGLFGGRFSGNRWHGCNFVELGYDDGNRDIVWEKDRFTQCGLSGRLFVIDKTAENVSIQDNWFHDCGKADNTLGNIVYLRGSTANLTEFHFDRNVVPPSSRLTSILSKVGGYTGTVSTTSVAEDNIAPSAVWAANNLGLTRPDYADDAAAAAGGVGLGGKYRTGSVIKMRVA